MARLGFAVDDLRHLKGLKKIRYIARYVDKTYKTSRAKNVTSRNQTEFSLGFCRCVFVNVANR